LLTELNVTECTLLDSLCCESNMLTELDVTKCVYLTKLDCWDNLLTELNVTECRSLLYLDCSGNYLTELDVTGLQLKTLNCTMNFLSGTDRVIGFTGTWDGSMFKFFPQRSVPGTSDHSVTVLAFAMAALFALFLTGSFVSPKK